MYFNSSIQFFDSYSKFFKEIDRVVSRAPATPHPYTRQGVTGEIKPERSIFSPRLGGRCEITSYNDAKHEKKVCPTCGGSFFRDIKHADCICPECGTIFDGILKTFNELEDTQHPSTSDSSGEDEEFYDPMFNIHRIIKLPEAEEKLKKTHLDECMDCIVGYHDDIVAGLPTIKINHCVTLNYCRKTGESWFGRTLIRTDPRNPRKKEFFCIICYNANKNQPYRNKISWHYIQIKKTKRAGYNEQAVLTAVTANPGRSINDIVNYCRAYFVNGNFSYGNVYNIIKQYTKRGKIRLVKGGIKNKTEVYRC